MSSEGTAVAAKHTARAPSSFGWIVTTIVALVVFKTLGVVAGLATFGAYYWLQPRIGTFFAMVLSAVLGVVVGVGLAVGLASNSNPAVPSGSKASQELTPAQMPLQKVGSLSLNYPFSFTANEAEAQVMMSGLSAENPTTPIDLSVYNSQPSCGLGEVRLVVATYPAELQASVDGAAAGAISRVSGLEGITNPQTETVPVDVSGLPARLTSFSAQRWGGVLGAEFLAVLDEQSNTLWQLQFIFAKNATSDYSTLEEARLCAKQIVKSVAVEHSL